MKSGQVLTDRRYKWFEPEYWRFGDPASAEGQINYMRHASGQVLPLLLVLPSPEQPLDKLPTLCKTWSAHALRCLSGTVAKPYATSRVQPVAKPLD